MEAQSTPVTFAPVYRPDTLTCRANGSRDSSARQVYLRRCWPDLPLGHATDSYDDAFAGILKADPYSAGWHAQQQRHLPWVRFESVRDALEHLLEGRRLDPNSGVPHDALLDSSRQVGTAHYRPE